MWHVYVLASLADGEHYVGMTSMIVQDRLAHHNAGRVKSTKGRRPFRLLHAETCLTAAHAREREKFLKSGQGRDFLRTLGSRQMAEPACGG